MTLESCTFVYLSLIHVSYAYLRKWKAFIFISMLFSLIIKKGCIQNQKYFPQLSGNVLGLTIYSRTPCSVLPTPVIGQAALIANKLIHNPPKDNSDQGICCSFRSFSITEPFACVILFY